MVSLEFVDLPFGTMLKRLPLAYESILLKNKICMLETLEVHRPGTHWPATLWGRLAETAD